MASVSRLDLVVESHIRRPGPHALPVHCRRCGRPGPFVWWGRYWRGLRTTTREHRIPVRRVRCRACGHAPGLLPGFALPGHRYARPLIDLARRLRRAGRSCGAIAERLAGTSALSPNLVLAWVRGPPPTAVRLPDPRPGPETGRAGRSSDGEPRHQGSLGADRSLD